MKNSAVKSIVAIGIGAALFFVCGRFIAIPCPIPNVTINIQYGVLAFLAAAFGPIVGLLAGLIGHALIDFSWGWGVWWSWVFATAIFGLIVGAFKKLYGVDKGEFGMKQIVRFNVTQLIAHIIAWGIVAPALDILMYAEPASKVFLQGLVAGASNIVTTAIVGTILCIAYSAAKPKKGSLKEEQ
ncbi:MAG: ECF-type riboflavin transporter substrate-binding protein [Firmicutes bacterium]|nr:ECF-type riboflavin transporter substrate-binding protein [Bacillota bacterium]